MDVVDELIQQVLAAAEPVITPAARHMIDGNMAAGEDVYALDDALQAVAIAGVAFPVDLLDQVDDLAGQLLDEEDAQRMAGWITRIRSLQPSE